MRETLIITSKFTESTTNSIGTAYRYIIDNKHKSSGAFNVSLLPIYEELFDIDWRESYFIELKKNGKL